MNMVEDGIGSITFGKVGFLPAIMSSGVTFCRRRSGKFNASKQDVNVMTTCLVSPFRYAARQGADCLAKPAPKNYRFGTGENRVTKISCAGMMQHEKAQAVQNGPTIPRSHRWNEAYGAIKWNGLDNARHSADARDFRLQTRLDPVALKGIRNGFGLIGQNAGRFGARCPSIGVYLPADIFLKNVIVAVSCSPMEIQSLQRAESEAGRAFVNIFGWWGREVFFAEYGSIQRRDHRSI
ncbi:hypothetical protein [Brucella pseudintermedia]|uniref:hypothetical protein n=1 Tax=Brucella pseudintermedia TaxID=370111 RepID=UPI0032081DEA